MGEVILTVGDRRMSWDMPDEVGIIMADSFVKVCGEAKTDDVLGIPDAIGVEVCKECSTGYWCGNGDCSQWTKYPQPGLEGAGVGTNNIVLSNQVLLDVLLAKQHELCGYATTDGDGKTCDCKYDPNLDMFAGRRLFGRGSEINGCPEMRAAVRIVRKLIEIDAAGV